MTPAQFRRIALGFPEAVEKSHMDHPDFRVGNKIFATLGAPAGHAMVKLTPALQAKFMRSAPRVFTPAAGAWGRGGSTLVDLRAVKEATLRRAMAAAWKAAAPPRLAQMEDYD